jgi:integrase
MLRIDLRNTRHTFAVRAIESKMFSLRDIQKILGHTSLEPIYQNYAKWLDDDISHIDRSIDLLGEKLTGN